jgi:hypothetical protein
MRPNTAQRQSHSSAADCTIVMNDDTIIHDILDLTIEDWVGLWEIVNKVSVRMPPGVDTISALRPVIYELLSKGWLRLYRSRDLGQDETEVVGREVEVVLLDPQNWLVPQAGHVQYRVLTTDAGDQAYYSGGA